MEIEGNTNSSKIASGNEFRCVFIAEALERVMRLSYHDRIKKTLPEAFYPLMPDKPTHFFKYEKQGK